MKLGERRGPFPEEELVWFQEHLYCESLRKLYDDYNRKFGQNYAFISSFIDALVRQGIFPITKTRGYDNLNEMLRLYEEYGAVHWSYQGKPLRPGPQKEPHWLWRWHRKSIKTPTGVSFRPYPMAVKERQFGEDISSNNSLQVLRIKRLHISLSEEQVCRGKSEEEDTGRH